MNPLFQDALLQALNEAHQAAAWQYVYDVWDSIDSNSNKSKAIALLQALTGLDQRAEYFRLTLIFDMTRELSYASQAATHALAFEHDHADRLISIVSHVWGRALMYEASRSEFINILKMSGVPQLVNRLTQTARSHIPLHLKPRLSNNIDRVALVIPYAGDSFHTPSKMAAAQCAVLNSLGVQVQIFTCQELLPPRPQLYWGSSLTVQLPTCDLVYWQANLPNGTSFHISDTRLRMEARWKAVLAQIATFDPDLVMVCGLYSPLSNALYHYRPVLALNVHAFEPIVHCDTWLSSVAIDSSASVAWHDVPIALPSHHPYRIETPIVTHSLSRFELGVPEDGQLWITVGARLGAEISGDWADQMIALLNGLPHVTWLLVGGSGQLPTSLAHASLDNIRALPNRNDIPALLAITDIYVNPPRLGGGFSVAEAMAAGCPVVSMADCDGGDKLGPFALLHAEEYMAHLKALAANDSLRNTMGAAIRQRFTDVLDLKSSGPSLKLAMDNACQHASQRFALTE